MDLLRRREADGREHFVFGSDSLSGHIEEPRYPLNIVAEKTGIRVSAHDLRRTYVTAASETRGRERASDQDAGEPRPAEGRDGGLHHGLGGEPAESLRRASRTRISKYECT